METGYLPLTGGTLSCSSVDMSDGYARFYGDQGTIALIALTNQSDVSNRRVFAMANRSQTANDSQALYYRCTTNGKNTDYQIFGQHNKPIGTYAGNGSASSRTINTGAIDSNFLGMHGNGYGIFVTGNGAIAVNYSSGTVTGIKSSELKYGNGVLTIAGNSVIYNNSTTTYTYQCF